jgi:hypothetical protein
MDDLTWRLRKEEFFGGNKRLCRGTLLWRKQYLVDVQKWGFHDARLEERVHSGFPRYCAMDEGDPERGESFLRN